MKPDIEIECSVKVKTAKAYLVVTDKGESWVPRSQISDETEERDGSITSIFMPEWQAVEKGLVRGLYFFRQWSYSF